MDIPIFVHHEGAQQYLRDCIMQAKKYNKRVILFGDKSNKEMCEEWQDVSSFNTPLWEEFKKYYRHLSSNTSKFEMLCFKRFFIFDDFMLKNNIEECISLDSDVLVFTNFSKIPILRVYNAAFAVYEGENAAWGGHGYWKEKVLHDFLTYCIEIYKNCRDKLDSYWKRIQKTHLPGGISDMTLLWWWYEENKKNVWLWTKYKKWGGVVDGNFCESINYLEEEYRLDKFKVGKKIVIRKGKPYFISIEHGLVRAWSIHFQGERKIYMHYFRKHLKIAFWIPYINLIKSYLIMLFK